MPIKKPGSLLTGHRTKAQKRQRAAAEKALTPVTALPKKPPPILKGHKVATLVWERLIKLYSQLEGRIVTSLDLDVLAEYCLVSEQVLELDAVRSTILKSIAKRGSILTLEELVKVDGRADRKRALLSQMRHALYLTPRARAGALPKTKPQTPPPDPMEEMLSDIDVERLDE